MHIKMKYLILSFFVWPFLGFSQEALELREYFPPSPTAQEFIKYGEYPVSMYTGVPNISIPIYNISVKDVQVPISLSYHSAGIQVDQIASEVGLGWSLNAGGMISKTSRGIPDDVQNGFLKYDVPELNEIGLDYLFLDDVVLGERDTESDLYHYNFGGYSGKFFFDREGETRLVEEKPISIKYFPGVPTKFVITTEKGVVYEFDETEQTSTETLGGDNEQNYTSTWHLSKITSSNGLDTVTFLYDTVSFFSTYQYNYRETTASGFYPSGTYPSNHEFGHLSSVSRTRNTPKRIKEIIFPNGKVMFNRTTGRLDTGSERLTEIEILKKNGVSYNAIKSFEFIQDYFYSGINIISPVNLGLNDPNNPRRRRLKLNELWEHGNTQTETKKHFFGYNEEELPPIGSNGKDFWGYYNGQNSNLTLLPKQDFKISGNDVGDADREPNLEFMDHGILNKITYPTGGYTEFQYEPHEYITTEGLIEEIPAYAKAVGQPVQIGGLPHLKDSVSINPNYSGYATLHIEVSNMTSPSGTFPRVILERMGAFEYTIIDRIITPSEYPAIYPPSNVISKIDVTFDPVYLDRGASYQLKVMVEGASQSPEFDGAAYILADITYKNEDTTNTTPVSKITGGLRIKQIKSYSKPNELAFSKRYEYSSQRLITPELFLREQSLVQDVLYMDNSGVGGIGCGATGPFQRRFLFGGTLQSLTLSGGSPVIYGAVDEFIVDNSNNSIGKTTYRFDLQEDVILPVNLAYMGGIMLLKKDWMGGQNKSIATYPVSSTNYITKEENGYTNKKYNEAQSYKMYKILPFAKLEGPNTSCWRDVPNDGIFKYSIFEYPIFTGVKLRSSTTKTTRDVNGDEVTTSTSIFYDNEDHLQPTRMETTNSEGKTVFTKTYYADDVISVASMGSTNLSADEFDAIEQLKRPTAQNLLREHRIAEPIQTETTTDGNTTILRTNYKTWPGIGLTLPEFVETSKGGSPLEERLNYSRYDAHGNPLEVSKADGSHISYIWGYNKQYPIAKLENATSANLTSIQALVNTAVTASDADNDRTVDAADGTPVGNEGALRTALKSIRNHAVLSDAMVTTYTYDPLIGVTSMTDPRGYTIYYEYDNFNRLKEVRDGDNNLVSDYQYHYQN